MRFVSGYLPGSGAGTPTAKFLRGLHARFLKTGLSGRHSEAGHTLAPLLNQLTDEKVGFRLTYVPSGGYSLEKFDLPA